MQKVLTAAEMREVDRLTTERYGIPSIILMENAAHAVARVITEKLGGSVKGKSILILCGKGNNGGDGAALARILAEREANVMVIVVGKLEETQGDAKANFQALLEIQKTENGAADIFFTASKGDHKDFLSVELAGNDVFVDAFVGTGVMRGVDQWLVEEFVMPLREWQEEWKTKRPLRVAVDLPSGLNSDSEIPFEPHFDADVTVTFTAPKAANILPPSASVNGELFIADIGSPHSLIDEQPSQPFLAEQADASAWLNKSKFANSSYKNKRGHALVIAGSESYSGAAVLVGDAAMRSGVGLVTVATPKSSKDSVASRVLPEIMVKGVADTDGGAIAEEAFGELQDLLEKADAVAIGSGLSQSESTRRFVQNVIENRKGTTIVDADALNLLSPWTLAARPDLILTPHEGEFMRLLGTSDKDAIKDRVAAVRDFATKNNVILVLKGERVLIGAPDGRVVVNPTGNSGLGKAGNGDTLTGILTGFAAQAAAMNIDIFETVVAAVYVAGMSGDIAETKYGKRVMTASDVRECLSEVFAELES